MKVGQLREILRSAAELYRDGGNDAAAGALTDIARLCDGRDTMTVAAWSKVIATAAEPSTGQP